MARQGITEEQVFEAAEQLKKEGMAITFKAIREKIGGTGSYSTINTLLARWREATDNINPTDAPDMPDTVNSAAQKFWTTAWKEAQSNVKAEREILGAARREMEFERYDMFNEIKRLETENEEHKNEIVELNALLTKNHSDINEVLRDKHKLKIENSELGQQVKDAIKRVDDIFEELKALNVNISSSSSTRPHSQPNENGIIYQDGTDVILGSPVSKLMQLKMDNGAIQCELLKSAYRKEGCPEVFPGSRE